jgi:hypothetical protein
MPVVLRIGRFQFFFFSNEGREPPHIHVRASGDAMKQSSGLIPYSWQPIMDLMQVRLTKLNS